MVVLSLIVFIVLLWTSIISQSAEQQDLVTGSNPQICKCYWSSSLILADCTNRGLTSIPKYLSIEMQVLDLSNNNILALKKNVFNLVGLNNLHKLIARRCSIK